MQTFSFDETLRERPTPGEIENDQTFLKVFLKPALLENLIGTEIPELTKLTEELSNEEKDIYSKSTYLEFHGLFVELLEGFEDRLSKLKASKKGTAESDAILFKVVKNMWGLHLLSKGAAL